MRHTFFGLAKSFVGAGVAAFGVFVLYTNLHAAAAQLSRVLCATPGEAAGPLPALVIAAAQVTQVYASGHQRFLQDLFEHLLLSCWPLLLILVGTAWFRDARIPKAATCPRQEYSPKKTIVRVDFSTHRSTC
jgi:hypothetical protein